jgi:hypothetical protein
VRPGRRSASVEPGALLTHRRARREAGPYGGQGARPLEGPGGVSLDQLVSGGQQRLWDGEAEGRGGLLIDDKLNFGHLLYR